MNFLGKSDLAASKQRYDESDELEYKDAVEKVDLAEINRGTSKMEGDMKDIIKLCEKRECEIKKLK